ncbi:hypothetical protein [Clostridium sp.]|uniref:hypothetical protein n=1 Tax=Clostridium sp. TaxID=1506 RepID=UPI001B489412|nr:hypothetical protein [Clostridium sp.]MBP3914806.1 hypothetical protein [Clostridium sp.]
MNKEILNYIESQIQVKEGLLRAYKLIEMALEVARESLPYREEKTEEEKEVMNVANILVDCCYLLLKEMPREEVKDALEITNSTIYTSLNCYELQEQDRLIKLLSTKLLGEELK